MTLPTIRRSRWGSAATVPVVAAALAALLAAAPASAPSVTILGASYSRLQDSKAGPTITGSSPVLDMPRGFTYRVKVTGHGVDLATQIIPGNAAWLAVSNVRRRNGLETRGPGELLFDVRVSSSATTYRRVPVTLHYVTGQTDRLYIEVHPGGRITSIAPVNVPAETPVVVTYLGTDLSQFVLSPGSYQFLRVIERSPTRLRIEYRFPASGPLSRYVTLGSKESGPTEIFAFTGLRPFSVTGAQSTVVPVPNRPAISCTVRPGQPCP